jgi:hypothetical protein
VTEQRNHQPASDVALDLDALERDGGTPVPFAFLHNGKRYLLSDPQEVDWQKLLVIMTNPVRFLQLVLPAEDHTEFFGTSMPAWKLNALMDAYIKHYGLPSPGEATGSPR